MEDCGGKPQDYLVNHIISKTDELLTVIPPMHDSCFHMVPCSCHAHTTRSENTNIRCPSVRSVRERLLDGKNII